MKKKHTQKGAEMKGIILSGGTGSRLMPSTAIISKQLHTVYRYPMIFYPLNTLVKAGIKDILIIVSPDQSGYYTRLMEMFDDTEINISLKHQHIPRGLPDAFVLGKSHVGKSNVALILGDNIFEDDFSEVIRNFRSGGHVFAHEVSDPERFGVVKFDVKGKAEKIVEKPKKFLSSFAVTGLYLYDSQVVAVASKLKPSKRGETEIVDLHNWYLRRGELKVTTFSGAWTDAGTHDSLLEASIMAKERGLCDRFHPTIVKAIEQYRDFHKEMNDLKLKIAHDHRKKS